MSDIKQNLTDDLIVRWFIRVLTGILLLYFVYYIIINNEDGGLDLTKDAWYTIIGSLGTWAAWEAIRPFFKLLIDKYINK